jgi:hypothetical protein
MSNIASVLCDRITPPVSIWAQTLDATSRAYDITGLTANGRTYNANETDRVWVTIQADGADCYFAFDAASRTIAEGTAVAAGGTPAYADTSCFLIEDGQERSYEITRNKHKFLMLKGSGAGTARISFTSENSYTGR